MLAGESLISFGGDGGESNPPAIRINPFGLSSQPLVCLNLRPATSQTHSDLSELLPQLIDHLIDLGELAREVKRALGGNGHYPANSKDLIQQLVKGER